MDTIIRVNPTGGMRIHFPSARWPRHLRRPELTIIVAMFCGNRALLGADSCVTDGDVRVTRPKLDIVDGHQIAWGFAGDGGAGGDFGRWLSGPDIGDGVLDWTTVTDWGRFRALATAEVKRINRQLRKWSPRFPRDGLLQVIVAGYLRGVPEVLTITSDGVGEFSATPDAMVAIGAGREHGLVAFEVLRIVDSPNFKIGDRTMEVILLTAATTTTTCGLPIRIITIWPDRIEDRQTPPAPVSWLTS